MKKIFTSFLLGALFLVSGNINAQFTATVQTDPTTEWCAGPDVKFKLSEVAAQMGCTTAQLVDKFEEWTAAANGDTNGYTMDGFFTLESGSASFFSEQYGGYEMNTDGTFAWWSGTSTWGVYIHYMDIETDELSFIICQNPTNPLGKDDVCHGTVALNLNGGKATFEFTFSVIVPDGIDKEAETDLTKINVVGETSISMEQEPNTEWWNYSYDIPVTGIADLLGIDNTYMQEQFSNMVFAKTYDSTNETWGNLTDKGYAVPSPGFYFSGGIIPEGTEEESEECQPAAYGDGNLFWICNFNYNAETQIVNCYLGQYPNGMSVGETRKADIYLVYGDKAYIIHYTFKVDVPQQTPITDYTKVGEETWTITDRDPRKTWDELEYLPLDYNKLASLFSEKLGKDVTPADFELYATNSYGGITDEYTADNDSTVHGFWMSDAGIVDQYSSSSTCYYIDFWVNDSCLSLGNKPNYFAGGENATGSVYIVVDSAYYEVKMNMTVMLPQYKFEDCTVEEYDMKVQLIPDDSSWELGSTSMTKYEEILGTTDGALYGVTSSGEFTTHYTVSEATSYGGGGFWMSPEDENHMAYAASYSGTGAFAMWYYESEITWFGVPGFHKSGDVNYGTFYIANLWDGKAIKLNVTIKYVDHIEDIKPVASEDLIVNSRNNTGEDFDEVALNLSSAVEQLVAGSEETLLETAKWEVIDKDGYLTTENFDGMYGFTFNADGEAVAAESEDAVFQIGFIDGALHSYVIDQANVNNIYTTTLYLSYNNKLYAFNIAVCGDANAIKNVEATSAKNGKIYDLSGRAIAKPTKGLYIQNGKKYLVK